MFSALYTSVLPPKTRKNPSKHGFLTKKDAEDYVISQFCYSCAPEYKAALRKDDSWEEETGYSPSKRVPCATEWEIVPTSALTQEELASVNTLTIGGTS